METTIERIDPNEVPRVVVVVDRPVPLQRCMDRARSALNLPGPKSATHIVGSCGPATEVAAPATSGSGISLVEVPREDDEEDDHQRRR